MATSRLTDQAYLRTEQYGTSQNLNARVELHRRFSANQYGWNKWQFDQVNWRPGLRMLDVGCGPAHLWRVNRSRLPSELQLVLSDFSFGMVQETHHALGDFASTCNLDVQSIPFPDNTFDIVFANHMLYHVPDIPRGLSELARVLKPGGQLHAASNGTRHLRELHDLLHEFKPDYRLDVDPFANAFGLENGLEKLRPYFAEAEVREYPDSLWVTEALPLADYAFSLTWGQFTSAAHERNAEFVEFIQSRINRDGGIQISKQSGVVVGLKSG